MGRACNSFSAALGASLLLGAHAVLAQSDGWQEIDAPGIDGQWSLWELGDMFADGPYSFAAKTERDGATLQIGCTERRYLDLSFTPPRGTALPEQFVARYSVSGRPVARHDFEGGPGKSYVWSNAASGEYGPAEELATAMNRAWKGEITVNFHEGPGAPAPLGPAVFTQTFPFDEDELGGLSEMILTACGLL